MPLNKITADSITDGTVVASDIADGTITLAKLQSGLLPPATANSAAAYANAAFATANTGTASGSYANSAFATANTGSASGSYANSAFATANTGSASGSYANSAFASANLISGVNTTQNTNITNASTYANSAFAKANTAGTGTVTSVSGTNGLTGTVTTSGSLSVDTAFGNIGTIAGLCNWSSRTFANGTVAGSSLGYFSGINGGDQGAPFSGTRRAGNVSVPGTGGTGYINTTAASGTWRALAGAQGRNYLGCPDETVAYWSIWIRIS